MKSTSNRSSDARRKEEEKVVGLPKRQGNINMPTRPPSQQHMMIFDYENQVETTENESQQPKQDESKERESLIESKYFRDLPSIVSQ